MTRTIFFLVAGLSLLPLGAEDAGSLVVDIRDKDVRAAAPGSPAAPGYLRVVFSGATRDAGRDYSLVILPPDRFMTVAFKEGTAASAPPVPSVMAVQALLEYLGYGNLLDWTNPGTGEPGQRVDGAFGLATKNALGRFLSDVRWKTSPDRVDRTLYTLMYDLFMQGRTGHQVLKNPQIPEKPVLSPPPQRVIPALRPATPVTESQSASPGEMEDHGSPDSHGSSAPPEGAHEGGEMTSHGSEAPSADRGTEEAHGAPAHGNDTPAAGMHQMAEVPADIPWTKILEDWNRLPLTEKAKYETLAREEVVKDGRNAELAIQFLVKSGWTQNRKSLMKGTEGIWLPRRFWKTE